MYTQRRMTWIAAALNSATGDDLLLAIDHLKGVADQEGEDLERCIAHCEKVFCALLMMKRLPMGYHGYDAPSFHNSLRSIVSDIEAKKQVQKDTESHAKCDFIPGRMMYAQRDPFQVRSVLPPHNILFRR